MPARPHYFLVRPGVKKQTNSGVVLEPGPIVPLIAVDQLPKWLEIIGLPRELRLEQTVGLSNLGNVARDEDTYEVKIAYTGHGQHSLPYTAHTPGATAGARGGAERAPSGPEHAAAGGGHTAANNPAQAVHPAERILAHVSPPPPPGSSSSSSSARPQDLSPGANQTPRPNPNTHLSPPPPPPTKPNKQPTTPTPSGPSPGHPTSPPFPPSQFCRHWCHHGTCKWGLACRYRHAMPTTVGGLASVGLRDFPAWWTAAMGLALSSSSSSGAGVGPAGGGYDVRMAARMGMFGGRRGREVMRVGMGYGPRREREKAAREAREVRERAALDRGRGIVREADAALAAGSGGKVTVLDGGGIAGGGASRGTQTVPDAEKERREGVIAQTQPAVQEEPEKLVDV